MSKGLIAFHRICKNLNSYEFTEEYKKDKIVVEKELLAFESIKQMIKALKLLKNNNVDIKDMVICLSESNDELLKEMLCHK